MADQPKDKDSLESLVSRLVEDGIKVHIVLPDGKTIAVIALALAAIVPGGSAVANRVMSAIAGAPAIRVEEHAQNDGGGADQ